MFASLKTAVLSAMIGLGAASAIPASAQADSLYLNFGGRHDTARFGVVIGDHGARGHDRWDRHGRWNRWERGAQRCTPAQALNKAERIGVRRARIADVDRRTITVRGRSHGDRVFVKFARAPRCPIIG